MATASARKTPVVTEDMEVEFVGGPFDGTRLILQVVRNDPNRFRIVASDYEKRFQDLRTSEVE
jgi:hypothetical protein